MNRTDTNVILGVEVEMDLTLQAPGIVAKFDAWRLKHPVCVESVDSQHVYRSHMECYTAFGLWLVGLTRGRDFSEFGGHNPANFLYVHVYPNVPMQAFAQDFWQFLEALDITEFELRLPWYVQDVHAAATELLNRARNAEVNYQEVTR